MSTWAEDLISFYSNFHPEHNLPNNIHWLYPQKDEAVLNLIRQFAFKYYNDTNKRTLLLGINPGRLGAGITGVNFTAPKQLKEICNIDHSLKMQSELSAEFIYEMIKAYGGPEKFYSRFFIGSVCPLGFIKNGKNINYYDDRELQKTVEPFIIQSIETQLGFPVNRSVCYCIGGEKNFRYLSSLNSRFQWFNEIIALPHPRFIMQYKRKEKEAYIRLYLDLLGKKQ